MPWTLHPSSSIISSSSSSSAPCLQQPQHSSQREKGGGGGESSCEASDWPSMMSLQGTISREALTPPPPPLILKGTVLFLCALKAIFNPDFFFQNGLIGF